MKKVGKTCREAVWINGINKTQIKITPFPSTILPSVFHT